MYGLAYFYHAGGKGLLRKEGRKDGRKDGERKDLLFYGSRRNARDGGKQRGRANR